jgi:hypothetical protein
MWQIRGKFFVKKKAQSVTYAHKTGASLPFRNEILLTSAFEAKIVRNARANHKMGKLFNPCSLGTRNN